MTTCLIWTVCVLPAASFCQQAATMSAYKFTPRAVASPDAHKAFGAQKSANWVHVKSGYSEAIAWRKGQVDKTAKCGPHN